ncbi:hypothetical protein [Microbacterium sp. NPDC087665]|uniref:hypothetical protein n=1 Tax=Microbacterium sp. NPDC087665 TaxID=3364194 RepID=UPI00380D53E5
MTVPFSIWKTVGSWVEKLWEISGTRPSVDPSKIEYSSATVPTDDAGAVYVGDMWNDTKMKHGLDDDTMFELFKKPFLREIAEKKLPVRFTVHPIEDGDYFLQKELSFLESLNYTFHPDTLMMYPPED